MAIEARASMPAAACAQALTSASTAREAAGVVVDHLIAAGVPLPSLYLLQGDRLRCQAQHGYGQVLDGIPSGAGVLGRCLRTDRTVVIGDATADADFLAAAPGLLAEICSPIRCDGRVVGVLNVESREPLPPGTRQRVEECAVAYGRHLAHLGGPPVESAAQRVARLAGDLAELIDEPAILQSAVDAAVQVSGMPTAAILARRRVDWIELEVACGPLAAALRGVAPLDLAHLTDWVASGTSMYAAGRSSDDLPVHGRLAAVGVISLAVVPLDARGQQLGSLLVASDRPEQLAEDMVASMEVLGSQTAASLLAARTLAEAQERARRDPLTGLGHAMTFREELQQARTAVPPDRELAVVLIDVDEFKAVNDRFGHLEGDRLLRRLSATLAGALRAGDRLYRIGGDEFAAILPVFGALEAEQIVGRLADAVRRREPSTISVGVAVARPGEGVESLISRADDAMYAAKAAGRDRTELAPQPN